MNRKGDPTAPLAEKRIAPRVPTQIPATVASGRRQVAFTVDDVSTSGARLTGQLPLEVGQHVRILLHLDNTPPEEIIAEVVRVHTADLLTDQVAVRFIEVPTLTHHALVALTQRAGLDDEEDRATGRIERHPPDDGIDAATVRLDKKKR